MDHKITIAIDGYSSTGKSTLARQLAGHFKYSYVDTGAMYRAVALYALRSELIVGDEVMTTELIDQLGQVELHFEFNPSTGRSEVHLNGENVETEIRQMEVSGKVSKVATISEVRKKLVAEQQKMGLNGGVVMDGRDIGTVVFPEAELKIYMTASPEIRIERRYQELIQKGEKVSRKQIEENLSQRDFQDLNRDDSPLLKAEDAVVIDNSNIGPEAQLDLAIKLAEERGAQALS